MPSDLFGNLSTAQAVDHSCLGCGRHHDGARTVTLIDGTQASSYSEAWRHECEAQAILDMPALYERQKQLRVIANRRGEAAAEEIKALMLLIWEQSKKATA